MDELFISDLPTGMKAAISLVDLLSIDVGEDAEFEPARLRLTARTPDL